jgi:hypothetical protein
MRIKQDFYLNKLRNEIKKKRETESKINIH